ncbi:phytase [Oceanicaulis alexandrii]|uniref:phytase n=2 Tax=Oceanicaulis alexandrii TaxID=153233 RepID=UPI003B5077B6
MRATVSMLFVTACAGALIACSGAPAPSLPRVSVPASMETAAVAGAGDAADDPALWRAADPARSRILGTDKKSGLYVYTLDGETAQYLAAGRMNNVDVRYGFEAGDETVDIAVASDRTNIALAVFFIDRETGALSAAPGGVLPLDFVDPYGLCLYQRPSDNALFAFVTEDDTGRLMQQRLRFEDGAMRSETVRSFSLGTITEGCAVDDQTGTLYIAEENVAVWVYDADPESGDARSKLADVNSDSLIADAEGVALWPQDGAAPWLVVSSQGDNAYAVFNTADNGLIGRFEINGGEIDRTSETDGIDVHALPLPGYPEGVFLAQDDAEDTGGQNFKLADLAAIRAALTQAPQ